MLRKVIDAECIDFAYKWSIQTITPFSQDEAQRSMITTSTAIYAYSLLQKRVALHCKDISHVAR